MSSITREPSQSSTSPTPKNASTAQTSLELGIISSTRSTRTKPTEKQSQGQTGNLVDEIIEILEYLDAGIIPVYEQNGKKCKSPRVDNCPDDGNLAYLCDILRNICYLQKKKRLDGMPNSLKDLLDDVRSHHWANAISLAQEILRFQYCSYSSIKQSTEVMERKEHPGLEREVEMQKDGLVWAAVNNGKKRKAVDFVANAETSSTTSSAQVMEKIEEILTDSFSLMDIEVSSNKTQIITKRIKKALDE